MDRKGADDRPPLASIGDVPLREVLNTIGAAIGVWVALMAVTVVVGFGMGFGLSVVSLPATPAVELPEFPSWAIFPLVFAFMLWFIRRGGVEFAERICSLSRAQCVLFIVLLGVMSYSWVHFHWLVSAGITWGIIAAVGAFDQLVGEVSRAAKTHTDSGLS